MLNTHTPSDSVILFLAIYPREIKTYVCYSQKKTCIRMFIAALFIHKTGNNSNVNQREDGNQIVVHSFNGILFSIKKE